MPNVQESFVLGMYLFPVPMSLRMHDIFVMAQALQTNVQAAMLHLRLKVLKTEHLICAVVLQGWPHMEGELAALPPACGLHHQELAA